MRSPSLSSAPAREPARSSANRQARGETGDSSRWRSAKLGSAASAGMRVARSLDELADAIELVRLGGPPRPVGACERPQRGEHPLDVGGDVVDRRAILAVGRLAVDGQQLAEVVQRAERVARQLAEAGEVVDALVDDLALGWR